MILGKWGGSSGLMWLISGTQESLFICCGQRRIRYRIWVLRLVKYLGMSLSDPHSSLTALYTYSKGQTKVYVPFSYYSCSTVRTVFKKRDKILLQKRSMHCFYGFWTGETLTHLYNSCIACQTLFILWCFRPIVSLPDGPCPMPIASREPEMQLAIDWSSPTLAQQTYSAWNQRISERFFLILGYVLSAGLSYRLVYILRS